MAGKTKVSTTIQARSGRRSANDRCCISVDGVPVVSVVARVFRTFVGGSLIRPRACVGDSRIIRSSGLFVLICRQ